MDAPLGELCGARRRRNTSIENESEEHLGRERPQHTPRSSTSRNIPYVARERGQTRQETVRSHVVKNDLGTSESRADRPKASNMGRVSPLFTLTGAVRDEPKPKRADDTDRQVKCQRISETAVPR